MSAFASAVRGMGAGGDGLPRLVVGTPDMSPGSTVRQLERVWEALQSAPQLPNRSTLPREIILAAPVTTRELAFLQHFVVTHDVAISARHDQIPTGEKTTAVITESEIVPDSSGGQWLHMTPANDVTARTTAARVDRPSTGSTTKASIADPMIGSSARHNSAGSTNGIPPTVAVTTLRTSADATSGMFVRHGTATWTAKFAGGSDSNAVLHAPQITDSPQSAGRDTGADTAAMRPDHATNPDPAHEATSPRGTTEERWRQEALEWRHIMDDDAVHGPLASEAVHRDVSTAGREEAWESYRLARMAEQLKAQHLVEVEAWQRSGGAGPSHVVPDRIAAEARQALDLARQRVSWAKAELRGWGNDPERLEVLHHEWQQQSLRANPRILGGHDPFGSFQVPDPRRFDEDYEEFVNSLAQSSDSDAEYASSSGSIRESSPEVSTDHQRDSDSEPIQQDSDSDSTSQSSEEWIGIHRFANEHGRAPSTMRNWANREGLSSRVNLQGRPEYRRSELESLLQDHTSYTPRVTRNFEHDVQDVLKAAQDGHVVLTVEDVRRHLGSRQSYASRVRNEVVELRRQAARTVEYHYGEDGHWVSREWEGWDPPGAPSPAQPVVGGMRSSIWIGNEASEKPMANPQEWQDRRLKDPVTRIETERFEPSANAILGQRRISGALTLIRHDIRRIQLPSGLWVREFTLRLHLHAGRGVSADQVYGLQNRVTSVFREHINQRYRFAGGDQFHVRVEFDGPTPHAHVVVHNGPHSDQANWSATAPDGVLAHEVMHFLGLRDQYPDEKLLLRRHNQNGSGVMGAGAKFGPPVLNEANLREIEEITAATNVLQSLPDIAEVGNLRSQSPDLGQQIKSALEARHPHADELADVVKTPPRPQLATGELHGLPSLDRIRRTLGKLPEHEYERLLARADGIMATPILIGTDAATMRARDLHEEKRQQVAFTLYRNGEESAKALARSLGSGLRPRLPGGSSDYYYSESEDESPVGISNIHRQYSVRRDDDLLYRYDEKPLDEVFENGFHSRNPEADITLMDHIWTGAPRQKSQWISTSRREHLGNFSGYYYEIDAPGMGVDVEMTYGDDYPSSIAFEEEVSFEGGIDRSFIMGADAEPVGRFASHARRNDVHRDSYYVINPNFGFPSASSPTRRDHGAGSDED
ncbi:scabin-related ADP-ribosyltransferase [Kitasatospora indigofera]|uniref:scabin-related ADP-ribosyltransferase n=1 Tax=Kitasatospora indigofera TaxID=67307 RepID=UPI00367BC4DC